MPFSVNDINDSNFEEIHRKFGSKMKFLRCRRDPIDLNRFPNIETLVMSYNESIVSQLKLFKLKQLEIHISGQGQEHILQTLIDNFPTLRHLNLYIHSSDENAIYKPLKNISNLKHLIHFGFDKDFGENNKQFYELLKQMAKNCKNLKSVDCRLNINDQNSDIKHFWPQLKAFQALKRFNLWLNFINNEEEEDDLDVNQLFSFELFKNFSNITHLNLFFSFKKHFLKESILKDIDINLPKLQYLKITNIFETTPEGVTQMGDILSRLSRLQTIQLRFRSGVDLKPIKEQITKKCTKIKEIKIEINKFS